MKYHKTLTAEQIGLLVTGLADYQTISDAINANFEISDVDNLDQINEAQAIAQAIQEEIMLVDPFGCDIDERVLEGTCLIVAKRWATSEEGFLCVKETTVTRESAAQWFLSVGDINKAKLLNPSIADQPSTTSLKALQDTTRTSDRAVIEALGVMAIMLARSSRSFDLGDKPNASQIVASIKELAEKSGYPIKGISNLNKDITAAVRNIQIKSNSNSKKPN